LHGNIAWQGDRVAGYLLSAIQRLYECSEERYFELMRESYSMVFDVDDTRKQSYGAYFDRRRPLSLGTMKPVSPG